MAALGEDPVPGREHDLRCRRGERVQLIGPQAVQEPLAVQR
ncbi:MAG TPA: hypothetical protein VII59_02495 [Streptosporangiaceae bacterium]